MTYRDFTLDHLKKAFELTIIEQNIFDNIKPVPPPDWLKAYINMGIALGLNNEKERSERIVSPLLTALNQQNNFGFTIYSGRDLNISAEQGLMGECDFMLSWAKLSAIVQNPIFVVVEAKHEAIDKGVVQCAAQMIGVEMLNKNENTPLKCVFGAATLGTEWRFLKLENQTLILDNKRYFIDDLPQILGVLQVIIDFYKD